MIQIKQIEHLNNPKHTPTSISSTINNLEKNIDSAKVRAFIPLAEKDSKQAKSYLREQLQFNDQEINLIMRQKNYCTKL